VEQNLENSMAVDISNITIPMSIADFARRERFSVAFGLLVATHERMEKVASSIDGASQWEQVRTDNSELQAYINTMGSILKSIKDGEKND
jgi:hypothetical protein